jgi:ribosomal-protein-serine acetyltransferase
MSLNSLSLEVPVVVPQPRGSRHGRVFPLFSETAFADGVVGIRRFHADDVAHLFSAARESVNDLCSWTTWCHDRYSLKECADYIASCGVQWENGESYSFAIFRVSDGLFLGSIGLTQINHLHRFANLGYWVRSTQTGRGVASAAVRLIARFALRELGFHRLEIVVPAGNRPSQRVAEKAGARREGLLRNRIVRQGSDADAIMYSLVAEDLPALDRPGCSLARAVR